MVATFNFDCDGGKNVGSAFTAQARGTDPYTPGGRCRRLLGEILGWGLDFEALRATVRDEGVALITGLPVDPYLPDTPQDGRRTFSKKTYVSEGLLNAVSYALLMHPVAMHNEKEGELIHQIASQHGAEASASNAGADVFPMHTEGTHMTLPPHVIALYCLRNTEHGATNFTSLDRAMKGAPPALIAALRAPDFTQSMGISSGGGGRYPLAIINGCPTRPLYRVDFTDVEATNRSAQGALDEFKERARTCEDQVILGPGDMVIINNHTSLHGRVGFTPDYSQNKQRWLQRQYMTTHPWSGRKYDDRFPNVWHGG